MDRQGINKAFEAFSSLNVLIVGDVMLDAYLWGDVDRISPEAPVPVVQVGKKEERLGGAANVALNTQALGATPITCSVIGSDEGADRLMELMKTHAMPVDGLVSSADRRTTVKTRVISGSQQMLRVDEEDVMELSQAEETGLFDRIGHIMEERSIDVLIFEDYNKGTLTPSLIQRVIALCKEHSVPTVVDPKKRNFLEYSGITLFKPNLAELMDGVSGQADLSTEEAVKKATKRVRDTLQQEISLVTLSEKGVFVDSEEGHAVYPAHVRDIFDVSGAGDTVVSVAALGLALSWAPSDIARMANLAGGLVCERIGVVPVEKDRLREEALALFSKK